MCFLVSIVCRWSTDSQRKVAVVLWYISTCGVGVSRGSVVEKETEARSDDHGRRLGARSASGRSAATLRRATTSSTFSALAEPRTQAASTACHGADTCHARFAHTCHRPPATRGRRSRRTLRVCRRRCAPAALLPVPRPRRLSRRRTRHVRRPSHARLASPPFLRRARQLSYSLSLSLVL